MKVVAIIQARMNSSRLPGKVLMPLGSTTVLGYLLNRVKQSTRLDEIIVATSKSTADDQIANYCKKKSVNIYRGSENNVLSRYVEAGNEAHADVIVRITGDCPLVDPELIDDCVDGLLGSNFDYISNCNNVDRPLPDGFDVEVFTFKSLLILQKLSIVSSYQEHVTFGYFRTKFFQSHSIAYDQNYSNFRVTLDYPEDLSVISKIVKKMDGHSWGWQDICNYLDKNKDIVKINSSYIRNASWDKSLNRESKLDLKSLDRDQLIANSSGLLSKRADQFSPGLWPKNYIKAKGQVIWAENNRLLLDYSIGGIGATTLGYACKSIDDAVIDAIQNGSATSLNSELELIATDKLIKSIPWIDTARYTRSGGEATTLAIRLARAKTNKTKVLFCGYHGWHDWYLSSAHNHTLGNHLLQDLPISGVPIELADTSFPFEYGASDDFNSLVKTHDGKIAAVILEPMRYSKPDIAFLKNIRRKCSENNIVMIFDEISSGFRFNNSVVHQEIKIIPDIVVLSKALGNGYPIACIGGKNEFMSSAKNTFISSTTHTESTGFAAMSAVLDYYNKHNVSDQLSQRGRAIKKILVDSALECDLDVSINGMDQLWSWKFDYHDNLNRALQTIFTEYMLKNSVLFSNRFYATLGIDPAYYEIFERIVLEAFKEISRILKSGDDPHSYIQHKLNKLGQY